MSGGALMFARYAYPPNALGYCGTGDAEVLLEQASTPDRDQLPVNLRDTTLELAERARHFEGAWPYLQLIAAANRVPDPLDGQVVEAYWVGNALVDAVTPAQLTALVESRFRRRASDGVSEPDRTGLAGPAHHSFHVFAIYPWMRMLRAGRVEPSLGILDRCRIRWGIVEDVHGDSAIVRSRPLTWDGGTLGYGPPRPETVTLARGGRGLVSGLQPGEWVALHWDWVCDRLTDRQRDDLSRYSALSLQAVNAGSRPSHDNVSL
jgi:Family of unknown function (DUF6390)